MHLSSCGYGWLGLWLAGIAAQVHTGPRRSGKGGDPSPTGGTHG
jgi:hypothetical protein